MTELDQKSQLIHRAERNINEILATIKIIKKSFYQDNEQELGTAVIITELLHDYLLNKAPREALTFIKGEELCEE